MNANASLLLESFIKIKVVRIKNNNNELSNGFVISQNMWKTNVESQFNKHCNRNKRNRLSLMFLEGVNKVIVNRNET